MADLMHDVGNDLCGFGTSIFFGSGGEGGWGRGGGG